MRFYIADVFCREKYSGNQLAVVFPDRALSDNELQSIAREFHFSETTFVLDSERAEDLFQVRIFTPEREVPFAGHPTLGTAYILRNHIRGSQLAEITLNLCIGKVRVWFDDRRNIQWMRQHEPTFGSIHPHEKVADVIGIVPEDCDTRFPVQAVSTGVEFLLVPLRNLNAVKKAVTNVGKYTEYFKNSNPLPTMVFCAEPYENGNSINCRVFADIFGIPEDPATGSANGCLAAYLTYYTYFGSTKVDIAVEQGFEIDRKSVIQIRSHLDHGTYNIDVGGRVMTIAEGELL